DDPVETVLVQARQVAGPEPALRGKTGVVLPVAAHQRRSAHPDLAVDELHLAMRSGFSRAAGLAKRVFPEEHDRDRRGFGGTVDLAHRHAALVERADQRVGHHHRAGVQHLEAAEIRLVPLRVRDHGGHGRRHEQAQARATLRHFGAQSARISLCSTVVRRQFSGTRIAPRRASANSNTSISGLLYPRYAMRSPLATASLLLTNSMRCHRSRYVQSFPSKWIATLDG